MIWACNPEGKEIKSGSTILAKVNGNTLLLSDLAEILPSNCTRNDSIQITKRYVDNWVKRQLMLELALDKIDPNNEDIQKKVEHYKEELVIYQFEKDYLSKNLDTIVLDSQIVSYYKIHRANFELKQNIVKGIFAKFPLDAPKMTRIKELVANGSSKDMVELKSYCFRFAQSYFLSENEWVDINKIVRGTPFAELANNADFVRSNKFYEIKDDSHIYLLGINDYKISDQISPLDYVKQQIINVIINERRLKLINKLENEILTKAKSNHNIEILP